MFFTLILENQSGDRIDMTTTANQYMTSKIDGLNPPAGTISTSIHGISLEQYFTSVKSINSIISTTAAQ